MRGYKNVINEAKRLNEEGIVSPLAIETSGHAALKENYFLDDGAYLIVKILIEMSKLKKEGKDIDSLIKDLKHPLETEEKRIKIKCEDFRPYGQSVIEDLKESVSTIEGWSIEPKNYEGIKDELFGLKTYRHIIFYRKSDDNPIEITRILHEQMDLKNRISE